MPTPSIQTLRADAQQVLNLDSISAVRSVVAATLANANAGTPLNPNLTTQQLWNEFYQIVTQPKSDIESIIANQLMKFLFAPPAPGGAGADKQVIFNDGGVLAGDPQFLWNKTTNLLTVTGSATITGDLTVATTSLKVTGGNASIGTATPNINSNRTTLTLNNAAWGGQLDINVGAVNHASFGTDNFSSGLSCRIQSADGIIMKTAGGFVLQEISAAGVFTFKDGAGGTRMTLNSTGLGVGVSPTGYGILALKKDNTSSPPYIVLDNRGTGASDTNTYTQGGILFGAYRDVSNPAYIASITVERKSAAGGASSTGDLIFGTAATPTTGAATERLRIDSSGNVGIGVTPSAWATYKGLQVGYASLAGYAGSDTLLGSNVYFDGGAFRYISTATASSYRQLSGVHSWSTAPSGTAGNAITFTQAMTLDASGNLLVGVTSAIASGSSIQNLGSARQVLTLKGDDQTSYTLGVWSASATGDNLFQYFGTETSLTVRGSIDYNRAGGLVRYNTTSDYRAKDIIGPVSNSGSLIDSLKVYVGKMKGATIERPMLIAHELQEVAPYAVSGEKDAVDADGKPKYQQMDASALVPLLIAEIKSLRARVQTLETR